MNWRNIGVVISREYLNRVKKKSFLIITFVAPILFAALCIIPSVLLYSTKDKALKVAVVDNSGIVMPYLTSNDRNDFEDMSSSDPEELKGKLEEIDKDVLLVISPIDSVTKNITMQAYSRKPLGVEFSESVESKASDAVEAYRIQSYNIQDLDKIMKDVKANVKVTEYTLDESGKETLSESAIYMVISMLLGMIIYMFIALFGGQVMSSVIEEKSSRVVEVLISSVNSIDLMFGKIIGIALVALTQFLLWIILTVVLVALAGSLIGGDKIKDIMKDESTTEMMSTMGYGPETTGIDITELTAADTTAVTAAAPSTGEAVINTLRHIPYGKILISFLIFFIFGYLLYASMYAAVGSAVENEADSQQLQLPMTIPLMIAFFITFFAFKNPDSQLVFWTSMIPFTSPIVMLARIPYGVPTWELVLSIALLIATFFLCAWISAKIYRVGILMYGKKSTFKDLYKWFKQK